MTLVSSMYAHDVARQQCSAIGGKTGPNQRQTEGKSDRNNVPVVATIKLYDTFNYSNFQKPTRTTNMKTDQARYTVV